MATQTDHLNKVDGVNQESTCVRMLRIRRGSETNNIV